MNLTTQLFKTIGQHFSGSYPTQELPDYKKELIKKAICPTDLKGFLEVEVSTDPETDGRLMVLCDDGCFELWETVGDVMDFVKPGFTKADPEWHPSINEVEPSRRDLEDFLDMTYYAFSALDFYSSSFADKLQKYGRPNEAISNEEFVLVDKQSFEVVFMELG